ncbi:hypothetical protein R6Q57_027784 [Mikania cordata]
MACIKVVDLIFGRRSLISKAIPFKKYTLMGVQIYLRRNCYAQAPLIMQHINIQRLMPVEVFLGFADLESHRLFCPLNSSTSDSIIYRIGFYRSERERVAVKILRSYVKAH